MAGKRQVLGGVSEGKSIDYRKSCKVARKVAHDRGPVIGALRVERILTVAGERAADSTTGPAKSARSGRPCVQQERPVAAKIGGVAAA